jgi:hypothetical protein
MPSRSESGFGKVADPDSSGSGHGADQKVLQFEAEATAKALDWRRRWHRSDSFR